MGVGVSDVACQQSIYAREREQRAEGLSCGVQGAATRLSSGACCGLVLPEPAVLVVRLSSRSGHFFSDSAQTGQRALCRY